MIESFLEQLFLILIGFSLAFITQIITTWRNDHVQLKKLVILICSEIQTIQIISNIHIENISEILPTLEELYNHGEYNKIFLPISGPVYPTRIYHTMLIEVKIFPKKLTEILGHLYNQIHLIDFLQKKHTGEYHIKQMQKFEGNKKFQKELSESFIDIGKLYLKKTEEIQDLCNKALEEIYKINKPQFEIIRDEEKSIKDKKQNTLV